MKRRFLAVIVAVVMIATGAGAQTRVYQGTLKADNRPEFTYDSEGGDIVNEFPSGDAKIRLELKRDRNKFSIKTLLLGGTKQPASRYRCNNLGPYKYWGRVVSCRASFYSTSCFFVGSCRQTISLVVSENPSLGAAPSVVFFERSDYPTFWTFRTWGSAVTRIR